MIILTSASLRDLSRIGEEDGRPGSVRLRLGYLNFFPSLTFLFLSLPFSFPPHTHSELSVPALKIEEVHYSLDVSTLFLFLRKRAVRVKNSRVLSPIRTTVCLKPRPFSSSAPFSGWSQSSKIAAHLVSSEAFAVPHHRDLALEIIIYWLYF